MSLKLFILFSFLLVQRTYGQNTFFGLQLPYFGGAGDQPLNDDSILLDSDSDFSDLSSENDTLADDIQNDVHTSSVQVVSITHTVTTEKPGWSYFIPSLDFNGFPSKFVSPVIDIKKLGLMLITRTHCDNVKEHRICKYTSTRYGVSDTKALRKDPNFDMERKTVIYFYGYTDDLESDATHLILDAYLQRDDHNLFVCDYHSLVAGNYLKHAVANIQLMAPAIADMIYKLNAKGFNMTLLHLVGHDLGAQMAGSVGKAFNELTEGTKLINRITGLDPSFLFFYPPIGRHITAKDAYFVDIIHTDAWAYGAPVATGTVDFWPNSGSNLQPGCPPKDYKLLSKLDTCSHYRAVRFWAESLLTEGAFLTIKCSSWSKFKKNSCEPKVKAYMGYDAKPGITGNYYLQTNGQQPFTRKHHGIIYDNID